MRGACELFGGKDGAVAFFLKGGYPNPYSYLFSVYVPTVESYTVTFSIRPSFTAAPLRAFTQPLEAFPVLSSVIHS